MATTTRLRPPVSLSYEPDAALKQSGHVPLADVAASTGVRVADLE